MSDDLDNTLRKALRPVDPGEDFTARVLARADATDGFGRPELRHDLQVPGMRRNDGAEPLSRLDHCTDLDGRDDPPRQRPRAAAGDSRLVRQGLSRPSVIY